MLELDLETGDHTDRQREFIKQRIASLVSGVGVVHVGANSDTEAHRIAHLVDDGQRACFTALKGGVVPGAGRAFHYVGTFLAHEMRTLENIQSSFKAGNRRQMSYWAGYDIVLKAICFPVLKIFSNYYSEDMENSLKRVSEIVKENNDDLKLFWAGWNINGHVVRDVLEAGIIDPLLVCESALKNAVSVVKQLIHSKYVLVEDKVQASSSQGMNDDEFVDGRVPKEYVKELYEKLDLLRINKEGK
jgi:chaperonin GroEL